MRLHAEPELPAIAAIIPSTLVGALVGSLLLGPLGFLAGGVLSGCAGALLAKQLTPILERRWPL